MTCIYRKKHKYGGSTLPAKFAAKLMAAIDVKTCQKITMISMQTESQDIDRPHGILSLNNIRLLLKLTTSDSVIYKRINNKLSSYKLQSSQDCK